MQGYIGVSDAGKRGYAVGIYGSDKGALYGSSCFEPNFPRVIKKVCFLIREHPEVLEEEFRVNVSSNVDGRFDEKEEALKGLQKLLVDLRKNWQAMLNNN